MDLSKYYASISDLTEQFLEDSIKDKLKDVGIDCKIEDHEIVMGFTIPTKDGLHETSKKLSDIILERIENKEDISWYKSQEKIIKYLESTIEKIRTGESTKRKIKRNSNIIRILSKEARKAKRAVDRCENISNNVSRMFNKMGFRTNEFTILLGYVEDVRNKKYDREHWISIENIQKCEKLIYLVIREQIKTQKIVLECWNLFKAFDETCAIINIYDSCLSRVFIEIEFTKYVEDQDSINILEQNIGLAISWYPTGYDFRCGRGTNEWGELWLKNEAVMKRKELLIPKLKQRREEIIRIEQEKNAKKVTMKFKKDYGISKNESSKIIEATQNINF
ncbi:MAG: hypothetical protein P9L97_05685 [Candidatus Tenebribacter davisii]|nr:hypothetical protein [Candidatus Tenebribacter davisii]